MPESKRMLFDEIYLAIFHQGSVSPWWHSVNVTKDVTINWKTSILQLQRNYCSWRSGGVFPPILTMQNN